MSAGRYTDRSRYHAVIGGGGVFGSLVAKRLAERDWKVLILEAGTGAATTWEGYSASVDSFRAALHKSPNSPYLPNPAAPSPDNTDPYAYFVQDPKRKSPYASDYLRALGGTTMHWEGVVPRMYEEDFLTKSHYEVGKDWPFARKEEKEGCKELSQETLDMLHKYYAQAEFELGVSGNADEMQFSGVMARGYKYPM